MSRLVVVSNRLPSPRSSLTVGGPEATAGGLTNAVFGALLRASESLWVGWNGRVSRKQGDEAPTHRIVRGVRFLGLPLSKSEVDLYYNGYCNGTLWPLLQ